MQTFILHSSYQPQGDQPQAIEELTKNIEQGVRDQVLLGVTGSGKTFTMANVIARTGRPTLIMAPNKTLAAQLFNEFREIFPENAVEYFVSYYDYYQPEAYLPHSDVYIEKDASINEEIDKLRHSATHALLTRRDVIIVASVSCIYGLGSPEFYSSMVIPVQVGQNLKMETLLARLVEIQYERNDYDFHRGTFRVRGDVVELIPAYSHGRALRLDFFGDEVDTILETDPLTGEIRGSLEKALIFPGSHYVSNRENLKRTADDIREELREQLTAFQQANKLVEAQRLEQRVQLDLEMLEEMGYCPGIENYARHMEKREAGSPPYTLLDYFPDDFLLFIDESHVGVPQIRGMFNGDRARKETLVNFGFRLPSAIDNRPLNFDEFLSRTNQAVYVSATPGDWEQERSQGLVTEQIIRPTGLLDPQIEIRPTKGQMDNLIGECRARHERGERVLVTTLTKRMAEDLTEYLDEHAIPTKYLHSDIDTLERVAIIHSLRKGEFSVLVGINLLREGLDIPEVSLVAILDADKEGFLRSHRSLIQTFGRAARNTNGFVLLYADKTTPSMQAAIQETLRRRAIQMEYNERMHITPRSVSKGFKNVLEEIYTNKNSGQYDAVAEQAAQYGNDPKKLAQTIKKLEKDMRGAAKDLEFEKAARLRDTIASLRKKMLG